MTKKVLFVLNNLEGGGAEKMMVKIMNGFVLNDIQVHLTLGKKSGIHMNSVHHTISINEAGGQSFFIYLRYFLQLFKSSNYTHVFTIGYQTSSAALFAKKLSSSKTKIYSTHHFAYPARRPLKYWKGDMLLKMHYYFLFPSADKIIAVSKGALAWLKKFSGRKLPQGIVIYNPAVDDSIRQKAAEPFSLPVQAQGKKILLTVGRLNVEKDHSTLLRAFANYNLKYPLSILIIVGEGPLKDNLAQQIKQLGLQQDVLLFGFQENPYKWMAACDVFILSSQFEGFGNVLAEAMSLGKTIVSTNCPVGPAEILDNGKFGYLCPVADPIAMAEAIEKAIEYPLEKEMLVNASRSFHLEIALEEYLQTLEN